MENNTRTGILGGTFNPPHRGHVDLGLRICEDCRLDNILYILSAHPPHKDPRDVAPAPIRWRMLNAALAPHPRLIPCDIEMKRDTPSWTIDTIGELAPSHPNTHFYFISGSEGFLKIRTWKNYRLLLRMLSFIVLLREESHESPVRRLAEEEHIEVATAIPPQNETPEPRIYIRRYHSDTLYISSTLVREKIRNAGSTAGLIDEPVRKILEVYKLYER